MPTKPMLSAEARQTMPVFSSRDSTDADEKNFSAIPSASLQTSPRFFRIVERSASSTLPRTPPVWIQPRRNDCRTRPATC